MEGVRERERTKFWWPPFKNGNFQREKNRRENSLNVRFSSVLISDSVLFAGEYLCNSTELQ